MKKTYLLLTATALTALLANTSNAAVIAGYSFTAGSANADITSLNVDEGAFTYGSGLSNDFIAGGGSTAGLDALGNTGFATGTDVGRAITRTSTGLTNVNNSSEALAVQNGDYFSVALDADDGFTMDLTDFSILASRGGNGPETISLWASFDGFSGFSSNGTTITEGAAIDLGTNTGFGSFGGEAWELDTIALGSTFDLVDQVEFRIYIFDKNGTATSGSSFEIDNLSIVGTVPEPSSFALLAGLTCLTFVMLRRRSA